MGTEAGMSAARIARGFTGRDRLIKFEGCYHGHADGFLVKTGSGALTLVHRGSAPCGVRRAGWGGSARPASGSTSGRE